MPSYASLPSRSRELQGRIGHVAVMPFAVAIILAAAPVFAASEAESAAGRRGAVIGAAATCGVPESELVALGRKVIGWAGIPLGTWRSCGALRRRTRPRSQPPLVPPLEHRMPQLSGSASPHDARPRPRDARPRRALASARVRPRPRCPTRPTRRARAGKGCRQCRHPRRASPASRWPRPSARPDRTRSDQRLE